jgi:hypothetical protein
MLEFFDRHLPQPGEIWMHHEGRAYRILAQDVTAFRQSDRTWNHGPFVKYQSLQNDAVFLVEVKEFMEVIWNGETVTQEMEFTLSEAYCRFERTTK